MRKARCRVSESFVEQDLLGRIRDVIVPTNDVGDPHVDVVGHDGEVVGRVAIGAQDDEVLDVGVVEGNRPAHAVVEARFAARHLEPDRARRVRGFERRGFIGRAREAGAVVHPAAASGLGRLPLLLHRLSRTVAIVGAPLGDQAIRHRAITIEPLGLKVGRVRSADVWSFVPIEPDPAQPVEDAGHHFPRGPAGIRVFDAQHERPAMTPRVEPVEERRPGAADMQVSCGGWGEADAGHRGNCTGIRDRDRGSGVSGSKRRWTTLRLLPKSDPDPRALIPDP